MPSFVKKEAAVGGVATVNCADHGGALQITIIPGTVSGTVSIKATPFAGSALELVKDSAGADLDAVTVSVQTTYRVEGVFESVEVRSLQPGDTFDLVVCGA